MSRQRFPLLGECVALELVNTLVGGELELLCTAADTHRWLQAHSDQLPEGALLNPPQPRALRALRTAIGELVSAAVEGRSPDRAALRAVNRASAGAPSAPMLIWGEHGPALAEAQGGSRGDAATLASVARSAIALLGGPDRDRLRTCAAPGCSMRFVATNPRRHWCSPETCGNRVRVARHYARQRKADGGMQAASDEVTPSRSE